MTSWSTVCKGTVYLQFYDKIQSNICQIFPDVFSSFYRTVPYNFHKPPLPPSNGVSPNFPTKPLLLPLIFFDQETPSPLQKMHNISVGLDKPPHMLFFCFKQSSLFGASFSSTVEHPLKSICSFNRPRCPFLNKIRALTDLFLNNFLFWCSPHFFVFERPNKNRPKKAHAMSLVPPPSLHPLKQVQETWTQSLVTNFLRITTRKIYWSPQARSLIAGSNFKLCSHKITTLDQATITYSTHQKILNLACLSVSLINI